MDQLGVQEMAALQAALDAALAGRAEAQEAAASAQESVAQLQGQLATVQGTLDQHGTQVLRAGVPCSRPFRCYA